MGIGTIKLALIGCGLIGAEHIRAWEAVARVSGVPFEVTAVCDTDRALAERAAKEVSRWQRSDVTVHTHYQDLLGEQIDGLDVCLPTHLHEEIVCAALSAGIHVMVEKPLATTVAAGKRMCGSALRAGRTLSLAEDHRRTPTIRTLRWLVQEEGALGIPEMVQAQRVRHQPVAPRAGWRAKRASGGGGWAIDNGAHLLDALTYVLGPVTSVTSTGKRIRDADVIHSDGQVGIDEREDFLVALLVFENGTTGIFSCASSLPGADDFCFALRGTKGAVVDDGGQLFHAPLPDARVLLADGQQRRLRDFHEPYLDGLSANTRERLFPFGLQHGFAVECAEFLIAVREGRNVEINAHSALRILATSLAFYESSLAQQTVQVNDVLDGQVRAYQETINPGPLESDFAQWRTRLAIPTGKDSA
ncbi:Gfo/Idh/MocA family protein [Streptomyces sp. NPDC092903]|uniref:Gfo/Idh/MocA family protein n=1 Tax=Streptomyces sp. NPDC092903 TaxID=3366017 RepID=UPI003821DA18